MWVFEYSGVCMSSTVMVLYASSMYTGRFTRSRLHIEMYFFSLGDSLRVTAVALPDIRCCVDLVCVRIGHVDVQRSTLYRRGAW